MESWASLGGKKVTQIFKSRQSGVELETLWSEGRDLTNCANHARLGSQRLNFDNLTGLSKPTGLQCGKYLMLLFLDSLNWLRCCLHLHFWMDARALNTTETGDKLRLHWPLGSETIVVLHLQTLLLVIILVRCLGTFCTALTFLRN